MIKFKILENRERIEGIECDAGPRDLQQVIAPKESERQCDKI